MIKMRNLNFKKKRYEIGVNSRLDSSGNVINLKIKKLTNQT